MSKALQSSSIAQPTIEEAAKEIIRTLRPHDPRSWDANMPYALARLYSLFPSKEGKCSKHIGGTRQTGKGLWEVPHFYGCDYPSGPCPCYCGLDCQAGCASEDETRCHALAAARSAASPVDQGHGRVFAGQERETMSEQEAKERTAESKCPKCGSVLQDITLLNAIKGFFCPGCSTHLIAFISVFLADSATKEVMPTDLGIKRYLQPEQRARYERRLKAWQEDHEEDAGPDRNERAILWMLMELKQAEEIIASLLHQRDEERMKAAAECLRLIRIAESAEQQRDEYKGKWNDVLEHEDKTLALARKLEAQLREKERELVGARSAAFREAAGFIQHASHKTDCIFHQIFPPSYACNCGFDRFKVELERIAEGAAPKGERGEP